MTITIAMYSHDSVGLGHARRNRAVAHALAAFLPALTGQDVRGLLIAGHPDAGRDSLPAGWDWLILPGLTHGDGGYVPRALGVPAPLLTHLRSELVRTTLAALDPDLFVVDRHPYGIDGELRPILPELRARGTRVVLGLREVLDTPAVACREWGAIGGADAVARDLDAIWVYGDCSVYDPRRTGELPAPLARIARATGYLANGRPSMPGARTETSVERPYVLTVLGGGADGMGLARHAVAATVPDGHRHLVVTGPQMPHEQVLRLRAEATEHTEVLRSASDVPELIADAAAVISMGGYNTACEIATGATPALMVPRVARRQEQTRRAHALACAGALDTMTLASLDAGRLTHWLADAVGTRTDRSHLALDGLRVVPSLAADLLGVHATSRPHTLEVSHHVA